MTATPEALTPEERAYLIESFNVSAPAHVLRDDDDNHVTKLLRIHDQQAARIAELERTPSPETAAALLMRERHAVDRLRTVVLMWAEQVKDLAPRIGLRAMQGLPPEVEDALSDRRRG